MGLRVANSVLRFVLELTALAILGIWGWHALDGQPQRLALTIAAPLTAAVAWGLFVAPRASRFLALPGRISVEALVFGSAAVALIGLSRPLLAALLASLALLNTFLVHHWNQDVQARRDALSAG